MPRGVGRPARGASAGSHRTSGEPAGAYGFTMASQYNGRALPPECSSEADGSWR